MLKKVIVMSFLVGLSTQIMADGYNCFRCIKAPAQRWEFVKEVTTCDMDRVVDLQTTEHYRCERLES